MLRSNVLYNNDGSARYFGEKEIDRYLIAQYLRHIKKGVYVECGAVNGVQQSNTVILNYGYDWGGILVEPNPHSYKDLIKLRPHNNYMANCALVSHDYKKEHIEGFFDTRLVDKVIVAGQPSEKEYGDMMSGQIKTNFNYDKERFPSDEKLLKVSAKTLDQIFAKSGLKGADFFSLDVEGYDLEVLNGWSPDKYPITYVLVEGPSAIPYLEQNNYTCIDKIDHNLLFKKQ